MCLNLRYLNLGEPKWNRVLTRHGSLTMTTVTCSYLGHTPKAMTLNNICTRHQFTEGTVSLHPGLTLQSSNLVRTETCLLWKALILNLFYWIITPQWSTPHPAPTPVLRNHHSPVIGNKVMKFITGGILPFSEYTNWLHTKLRSLA